MKLMGEMHEVRGTVEHLHKLCYLEVFDCEVRLSKRKSLPNTLPAQCSRIAGEPAILRHVPLQHL
jgi:hypothetical protein